MTTLVFKGCGMNYEPCADSDIGNHRIRTTLRNNKGRYIYLELGGRRNEGYLPNKLRNHVFPFHVSHCFDVAYFRDCHDPKLSRIEHMYGEYTKHNLLGMINSKLDCNYTDIEIRDDVSGFEFKAIFKANYPGCFKEWAGKEVTISEAIECNEGDSLYWFKVKDIEEAHLIKSKNFMGE